MGFFSAAEVGYGEPFDRAWEGGGFFGDHAGEGWCEFGTDGEFAAGAILEVEEFTDDAVAGLDFVEIE